MSGDEFGRLREEILFLYGPDGSARLLAIVEALEKEDARTRRQMDWNLRDKRVLTRLLTKISDDLTNQLAKTETLLSVIRESEHKHRSIVNTTVEGYLFFGGGWEILEVNDTLCSMAGYSREEITGKLPYDLIAPASVEYFKDQIEAIQAVSSLKFEATLVARDGRPIPAIFSMNLARGSEGEVEGAFAFVTDISHLKQTEQALKKAKEKAEEATKTKDRFVSLVSHDLRSPLAGIIGMCNLLTDGQCQLADSQKHELLSRVGGVARGLVNMIDQLLDIGRLKSGGIKLVKKPLNPRTLAAECIESNSFTAHSKGVTLKNDLPENMEVTADKALLGEVLQNLVSNAVKFCNKGDGVRVYAPEGTENVIAVGDTGAGIPEKLLPDLFRHEVKTSLTGTAGEKGTGLGLPFCHDIVTAHGGEIWAESKAGEGSVFFVKLPRSRAMVLIADDQEIQRFTIRKLIEKFSDARIVEAVNGKDALDAAKAEVPALIITDMSMPVMGGIELLASLKSDPDMEHVPVIIMTAGNSSPHGEELMDVRTRVLKMGASDFISIPVIAEEFIPRVKRYI
ncbi:MAG: response regulator [Nitrospinae bacterium]|nr:response regulator [Nitrospinota bacterium]